MVNTRANTRGNFDIISTKRAFFIIRSRRGQGEISYSTVYCVVAWKISAGAKKRILGDEELQYRRECRGAHGCSRKNSGASANYHIKNWSRGTEDRMPKIVESRR